MNERKFYYCSTCHNLFEVLTDSGATPICCGHDMTKLKANSTDAAVRKTMYQQLLVMAKK